MASMTWANWVTLGVALLGAGLGLFNTWHGRRDRAVRFGVRVTQAIGNFGPTDTGLSIEITNLSSFAISIVEVGLTVGKPKGSLPRRAMIPPHSIVSGHLPMKLDARHSGSVIGWAKEFPPGGFDHAYARASGGEIAFGTSAALLQWVASLPRYR